MTIDLSNTVFDFSEVVGALDKDPNRTSTVKHKGKLTKMLDFGLIIIGPDSTDPQVVWFKEEAPAGSLAFSVPVDWRMSHVMKALGVFKSVGEAKNNGWNIEIPEGFSQHVFRVRHVQGVVNILKLVHKCPSCGNFMVSDTVGHEC